MTLHRSRPSSYAPQMPNGPDLETRVAALEARMEQVAADAAAARHLAAANDRDLSGLSVNVDAHRAAINALGVQTAARFDRMETLFDRMETRFDGMETRVDRMETRVDGLESEMRAGFAVADENFTLIDENFRKIDAGFTEIRGKLDQTTAGLTHIVTLLTDGDPPAPPGRDR